MGIFQQFPYTNFHELNLDEILKLIKEYTEKVDDFILDIDQEVADTVDAWIRSHPEVITTVQDHSLKSIKFYGESVPFYNVNDYGILPNGQDNYEALHEFFKNYVYNTGGIVFFPAGRYITSDTLFIPENTMVIGEGENTEIFFDEQYTSFGVGLSNAGSNVTIKNIKVTQRSTGVIHSGVQPGCIGFANNAKEMATSELHTTTFLRAEATDLAAENIYTDESIYVLQTENTVDSSITGVTYKNIKAPSSCVSVVASSAGINDVLIENVQCDVFRISWNDNVTGGIFENVTANNVRCQTPIFNSRHVEQHIIINNMIQTTNARQNVILTATAAGIIDGNITFNDCIFNTVAAETDGFLLYQGIRVFNNCVFHAHGKAATRNSALSDTTNYEIMNNCIISCGNDSATYLIGYGRNNKFTGNVKNMLWGNAHKVAQANKLIGTIASVTASVLNRIKIEDDIIMLQLYVSCADSEHIIVLNDTGKAMLDASSDNMIPVVIFNSSTPDDQVNTFAIFDADGTLKVCETAYSGANAANYNRAKCSAIVMTNATPTPTQIYTLLN